MNKILLMSFLTGILLFSCKSSKDLIYMNNVSNNEVLEGIPKEYPEHIIKTNDNLYIDIRCLDPEINSYFSASGSGTNSAQMDYGQLSGQYLNGYQVDLSGQVILPIVGDVHVEGKTLEEARLALQKVLDTYIKDATVKVKLLSFKLTVLGEVKNPGVYYNYNNNINVLEAIAMANGITDYGRIQKVLILRKEEKGSRTYRLDLTNKKFLSSDVFFLQSNDVLYVEPDRYKNVKLNSPMYSLFLSTVSTLILILNIL